MVFIWHLGLRRAMTQNDITQKQKSEENYYFVPAQNNRVTISFNASVAFEY